MSSLDLRCTTVAILATQYLENELDDAQRTSYETHLVLCDNCQTYLGDLRGIADALRALPADAVDDAERGRILGRA
jgi:anti-sigma factor RsiW